MEAPSVSRDASLKSASFTYRTPEGKSQQSRNEEFGFGGSDRRFAFARQASFRQSTEPPHTPISINDSVHPLLSRSVSSIVVPPSDYPQFENEKSSYRDGGGGFPEKFSFVVLVSGPAHMPGEMCGLHRAPKY